MKPTHKRARRGRARLLATVALMAPVAAGQAAKPAVAADGTPVPATLATARLQFAQLDGDSLLLMLPDSLDWIRGRQNLVASRDALERDLGSPVAGNSAGDVTVVEFFDYRCPYCRRFAERLTDLFKSDPGIRFVFKEWPMFGGVSVTAARAALAADRQGQYLAMHEALMDTRLLVEEVILTKAAELGLDTKRLETDMASPEVDRQLAATARLAEELGLRGTPAFVVGKRVLPGLPEDEALVAAIAAARGER